MQRRKPQTKHPKSKRKKNNKTRPENAVGDYEQTKQLGQFLASCKESFEKNYILKEVTKEEGLNIEAQIDDSYSNYLQLCHDLDYLLNLRSDVSDLTERLPADSKKRIRLWNVENDPPGACPRGCQEAEIFCKNKILMLKIWNADRLAFKKALLYFESAGRGLCEECRGVWRELDPQIDTSRQRDYKGGLILRKIGPKEEEIEE